MATANCDMESVTNKLTTTVLRDDSSDTSRSVKLGASNKRFSSESKILFGTITLSDDRIYYVAFRHLLEFVKMIRRNVLPNVTCGRTKNCFHAFVSSCSFSVLENARLPASSRCDVMQTLFNVQAALFDYTGLPYRIRIRDHCFVVQAVNSSDRFASSFVPTTYKFKSGLFDGSADQIAPFYDENELGKYYDKRVADGNVSSSKVTYNASLKKGDLTRKLVTLKPCEHDVDFNWIVSYFNDAYRSRRPVKCPVCHETEPYMQFKR